MPLSVESVLKTESIGTGLGVLRVAVDLDKIMPETSRKLCVTTSNLTNINILFLI